MLQEVKPTFTLDPSTIQLTEAAASAVKSILAERNLAGYGLRVYVAGSGCCGAQFGMALDNNIRANDFTFETDGVQVIVDDSSIDYLRGAKVDYINDPARGAGFTVDSPVSLEGGSCSCGSHADSAEEESSCECGGSCSCGAN